MITKEQIEAIIKELQKILRIQDWDITFEYCGDKKMQELTGECTYCGCCDRDIKLKRAKIYINKDHEVINEWYPTLVHELYHIITNDVHYLAGSLLNYVADEATRGKECDVFNNYMEQMIEILAKGFVNAYPASKFNHILLQESSHDN
jgi:predicted metal-dependent peptidase